MVDPKDQKTNPPPAVTVKPVSKPPAGQTTGIIALIAVAVVAVAPLTKSSEGTFPKAYYDPVKIPTACTGHTMGVKITDVYTVKQCDDFFTQDMTAHAQAAVKTTPSITENKNYISAAGDFSFNSGDGAYARSPMARYALAKQWKNFCQSFTGYYTGGTFSKPQPKLKCVPSKSKPGKFVCELPGLVKRRINETKMCFTGTF